MRSKAAKIAAAQAAASQSNDKTSNKTTPMSRNITPTLNMNSCSQNVTSGPSGNSNGIDASSQPQGKSVPQLMSKFGTYGTLAQQNQATSTQQGIKATARPMSGAQSQGSLQMISRNHRKSTTLMTTKELGLRSKKTGKILLNKSNNNVITSNSAKTNLLITTTTQRPQSPSPPDTSRQRNQLLVLQDDSCIDNCANGQNKHVNESIRQRPTQQGLNSQSNKESPVLTKIKQSSPDREDTEAIEKRRGSQRLSSQKRQRNGKASASSLSKPQIMQGARPIDRLQGTIQQASLQLAQSQHQQNLQKRRNVTARSQQYTMTHQPQPQTQNLNHSKLKGQQQLQMPMKNQLRPRVLTPGTVNTAGQQMRNNKVQYEYGKSRQLQHEIEVSDDAPYKPSMSGFRHNQNKNQHPSASSMDYSYVPRSHQSKILPGSTKNAQAVSSSYQHFATEGNAFENESLENPQDRAQQQSTGRVGLVDHLPKQSHSNGNLLLLPNKSPNHNQQQHLATSTSGNDELDGQTTNVTHPYQTENQKIEYVTKSYQGSAWCCQSSEAKYDQSQLDTSLRPLPPQQPPRPLTFKEKVVEMMGWAACTKATTRRGEQELTLEDGHYQQPAPISTAPIPRPSNIQASDKQTGPAQSKSPFPKLTLSQPPSIGQISIMPRTRRQQLGLTPQTNMRLFKCDDQVGRKSILSNQSIIPCSEDSFISTGLNPQNNNSNVVAVVAELGCKQQQQYPTSYPQSSAQNLSTYNQARSELETNKTLQEERKNLTGSKPQQRFSPKSTHPQINAAFKSQSVQMVQPNKQSTHSYEYMSSVRTNSTGQREAESIIENLQALNITIQKREKELALQQDSKASRAEIERKRQMLINADSNSVNSQIPCESESGGGPALHAYYGGADKLKDSIVNQGSSAAPNQTNQQQPTETSSQNTANAVVDNTYQLYGNRNKKSISVNFESVIMLENKLNRIAKCLLMVKYAEEQATYQYTSERQMHQAIQNYQIQHEELIGLCEEYWTILRQEAYLFCKIPQRMFKDKPQLVAEIRKTFILKLLVVSQVGYLTSNEEFQFNDTSLQDMIQSVCQSFLYFMRVLLGKLNPGMLSNFFWARKLNEIVQSKLQFEAVQQKIQQAEPVSLSASLAVSKLQQINAETVDHLKNMFEEMDSIRQDEELRDNSKYEHPIFQTVQDILLTIDDISFKDASTLIGRSLVSEFSELDSSDSVSGEEAMAAMRRNEAAGGTPMNQHVKVPFLPALSSNKEYTLVLDLDETLVHYYEEKNTVLIRPYATAFLQQMAQFYEVVIFTAGTKDYADWALAHLQNQAAHLYIDHRLYRDHTIQCMDVFIKDLSNLGRNLDKTIIVDNITENFLLQPDNGISIKSWFDDPDDTALADLAPLLQQIVEQKVADIRVALKESKDQLLQAIASGDVNPTQRLKQLSFSDRSDAVSSRHNQQTFNESEIDETAEAGRSQKLEL